MSRAFVREDSAEPSLPDRPLSPHPNYVTARGLAQLKAAHERLQAERAALPADALGLRERRAELDRELRWYAARIDGAIPVPPASGKPARVGFGNRVLFETASGEERHVRIVGEDEADGQALISWVSPLGFALLGAEIGDCVLWQRPAGDAELYILDIEG
ncbi:GreA/GreB family elongation factor [Plasticicumulans acidivorans]|uniref:Transcription elongation GreA/GreB family factor n=1 Tax=Plasticicumulans acidivorans TaxID=886464 RepID=A0A317MWA4_9GAMM|nr:GreA/GreB family elongation factor [Plasticicumulans acidivorans]PWV62240.1 transcription elongation GreA/GreB family factor [Plasticicumulans acidivorans]